MKKYTIVVLVGLLIVIIYLILKINLIGNPASTVSDSVQNINLWIIFITGLTVGGLSCLAVQGGLLASVIASGEDYKQKDINKDKYHSILATGSFLVAKLISYTALGFILGAFGGALNISPTVQVYMQIAAGIYILLIALNLLEVHPIFRYAIIQSPRFLTQLVKNQSRSKEFFAPALLGVFTIFIPCGTTLAMEALAISSGSALLGASIMFVFILGTTPLFVGFGWVTSFLGENFKKYFFNLKLFFHYFLQITFITPPYIPIEQVKAIFPTGWAGNSIVLVSLGCRLTATPKEGTRNADVQLKASFELRIIFIGIPCLTVILLGL